MLFSFIFIFIFIFIFSLHQEIIRAMKGVKSRIANPYLGPQRYIDNQVYQVAAKRIRGDVLNGPINPGATGTITGLKGVDGLAYETDPLNVRNKITGFAIPNGSTVLAQWVQEDQEWQVIEIAGEGSPTTPEPRAYLQFRNNDFGPFASTDGSIILIGLVTPSANMTYNNGRITAQIEGLYSFNFCCSVRAANITQPSGTPVNLLYFSVLQNGVAAAVLDARQVTRSWETFEPIPYENVNMSGILTMLPGNFIEVFCSASSIGTTHFTLDDITLSISRVSTNLP